MEGEHTMANSSSTSPKSPPCASRARMKRLLDEGNNPKVLDTVPIDRYCKTMIQMYDVAQTYLRDKQYEKAFILLLRYSNLAVSLLPKHKNWNDWSSVYKTDVLNKARYAIGTAQDLRRYLEDLYEKEFLAELARIQKEEDAEAAKQELIAKLEQEKRVREENARAALMIQKRNEARIENPGFTTDAISFGSLNSALTPQGQKSAGNVFDQLIAEVDAKVIIAGDIAQKFLAAAQPATANNIETCGILCGINYKSKLIITHVILPRQHGTPNSCFSEGEEDLFEAQSRLELLTFGWIHTHPSQTAFLSSVDLHTHHAYQTAVEEAVAIVCAPSFNEIGTYVITPEGMKIIGGCKLSGFHPHTAMNDPIFTEAPHARYSEKLATTMVDLRSKT